MKKQKAIIFDMDGLLIDSEPLWFEAEKKILKTVGIDLTPEMVLETRGLRADEVISHWHSKHNWEKPSEGKLLQGLVDLVVSLIKDKAKLLPGAEELLDLSFNLDYKVALASSSHMDIINAVLDKFNLDKFDFVHSAEKEEKGKPDPAVYLTACKSLGVDPSDSLAFEDSVNGMRAAKAAGMYCVAVPAAEEMDDPRFGEADLVIESLKEVNKGFILNVFK